MKLNIFVSVFVIVKSNNKHAPSFFSIEPSDTDQFDNF